MPSMVTTLRWVEIGIDGLRVLMGFILESAAAGVKRKNNTFSARFFPKNCPEYQLLCERVEKKQKIP